MAVSRRTKWLLGIALVCVVSLVALPYALYEYVTRERWRLQYLDWEPITWAPEYVNAHLGEINAIGAKRRWTDEDATRLEEILSIDLDEYDGEATNERVSDRYLMAHAVGDALLVISDRLLRGPLDDEALRRRLEEALMGALDHKYLEVRATAIGAVVECRLVRRPEVHARLLVLQYSDSSDIVRSTVRIQLENDAVRQGLERKGKVYVPPDWLRRR